jgi:CheY-like chemotaxis protein
MATVLLADDHPMMRSLVRTVLEAGGHQVIEATDGVEALQLASSCQPALVLLDWSMPGLTGLAVCRQLRADSKFDAVPVIFMSGHLEPAYARAARAAGANDCLLKPVEPDVMLAAVERALMAGAPARPPADRVTH